MENSIGPSTDPWGTPQLTPVAPSKQISGQT